MAKYVQYRSLGMPFAVRSLTRSDWAGVGIDHDTITWDKSNAWLVPIDQFTDDMLPYIAADVDLTVVDLAPEDLPWNSEARQRAADGLDNDAGSEPADVIVTEVDRV